jgi:hypothetical protein
MKVNLDDVPVYLNPAANRIEARIDDYLCLVDFIPAGPVIIFTHTEVPNILSGNGIAAKMVRFALDYAEENGKKIIPKCPYFSAYLTRHSEYQSQIYSWTPRPTEKKDKS